MNGFSCPGERLRLLKTLDEAQEPGELEVCEASRRHQDKRCKHAVEIPSSPSAAGPCSPRGFGPQPGSCASQEGAVCSYLRH